jgi:hypothetical protein
VRAALLLLSKPGCHLCHEMRDIVLPVLADYGLELVERDVRDDPETRRRYLLEIPVLLLDGTEIARHRVTAAQLRRRLDETLGASVPSGS